MYQGKYIKCTSKINWYEFEYHVQYIKDVPHISVRISCATNYFPETPNFWDAHETPWSDSVK